MKIPMLFRFSLYGFLKNQQYYDFFMILMLWKEKGLSFLMIGTLVGFRELSVNLMEVPSGVIADLCGRRRSMILSLSSYIISFLVFGLSSATWHLFAAMFFFAVGEAFRTGTHKAMILHWLRLQGRQHEKTKTYGFTRSWSKIGSAVAVPISVGIVLGTGSYAYTFLFAVIPYLLGIVNFLGYPPELDGRPESTPTIRNVVIHLGRAFRQAFLDSRLRRVLIESMGYESTFKVVKDYLQPVIRQMALALPVLVAMELKERTAILIGVFYLPLHIVSGVASRKADAFARRFGGESRAARHLWAITLAGFVPIVVALWFEQFWAAAIGFLVLALLQNFWRPMLITRVDNETDAKMGATMLSIESQAKAVGAMILAPLLGLGVDRLGAGREAPALWMVGLVGVAVTFAGSLIPAMRPAKAERAALEQPS